MDVVRRALRESPVRDGEVSVAVVPFASLREDRGLGSVEMWKEAGAASAVLVPENEAGRALIEAADLIWLGGGSQQRLMDSLERLDFVELIRARHRAGAVIGGTSAGAAVLGGLMISGPPEPEAYTRGAMPALPSLQLVPGVIVDQHFREREREGRLISALLDRPSRWVGVGISESTAAIFRDGAFEVMGEGVVLVIDPRQATVPAVEPEALRSASGIKISVHVPGERCRIDPASGP